MLLSWVLEKTLASPLDSKEIKPVNPKGNQPWTFIGRTNAEAEAPILCHLNAKSWFTGKDPVAGKDWRQKEKGVTEDEMVEWHHLLDGHEFEQALGVGDGLDNTLSKTYILCWQPWAQAQSQHSHRGRCLPWHAGSRVSHFTEMLLFTTLIINPHLVTTISQKEQ